MARTSKTIIGGGAGEQSDRMMRAEDSGQARRAQAHGAMLDEQRAAQDRFAQMGNTAGQFMQQHQQFQEEQHQFDVKAHQAKRGLQLEGKKAGFDMDSEQEPRRGGATAKGPQSERERQLAEEMERGAGQPSIGPLDPSAQERLKSQTSKPLEDNSGWRINEQGKQAEKVEAYKADTERIRAETQRDRVGLEAQRLNASGNTKEAKELAATLAAPVNGLTKQFDKLMRAANGKEMASSEDWSSLKKLARGGVDADPSLMADLEKNEFTTRVQQFLRAQISTEAIKYIVRTGDRSQLEVDWTAPKLREFTEQVGYFNSLAQSMGPEFANFARINSVADKMQFLNQQAAMSVMLGMSQMSKFDKSGEGFLTGDEQSAAMSQGDLSGNPPEGEPGMPPPAAPGMEQQQAPQPEEKMRRFEKPGRQTLIRGSSPTVNRPAFEPRRGSEYEL